MITKDPTLLTLLSDKGAITEVRDIGDGNDAADDRELGDTSLLPLDKDVGSTLHSGL